MWLPADVMCRSQPESSTLEGHYFLTLITRRPLLEMITTRSRNCGDSLGTIESFTQER